MSKGIDFGSHKYTAVSDEIAGLIAESRLPLTSKVLLACQTAMNNWGHAYFHGDELALIVYGDVPTRRRRETLADKVKQLCVSNLVAPESTVHCVVLNSDLFQRGAGKGSVYDYCSESTHHARVRSRWSASHGWVNDTPNEVNDTPNQVEATPKQVYDLRSDLGKSSLEDIEGLEGPEDIEDEGIAYAKWLASHEHAPECEQYSPDCQDCKDWNQLVAMNSHH